MCSKDIAVLKERGNDPWPANGPPKSDDKMNNELLQVTKHENQNKSTKSNGKYPGIVIGNETCEGSNGMVPKYIGWLWNVEALGVTNVQKGWWIEFCSTQFYLSHLQVP